MAPIVRSHSVSTLLVHAVWATAGRLGVLGASADTWLARELRAQSADLGAIVLATGTGADHVHVVLQHPPGLAVAALVGWLKASTSRAAHLAGVFEREHRWQVGYWAESVGRGELGALVEHVEGQRAYHEGGGEREAWEEAAGEG